MLSMVKCSVLLVARWANQVVQDRRWSGWSAAGLCGGNPQYLVSPLLLFCISVSVGGWTEMLKQVYRLQ